MRHLLIDVTSRRLIRVKEEVIHEDITTNYHQDWNVLIRRLQILLQEEATLLEIVRLVGVDSLSKEDRIKLLSAQMIREDFLHQNAYHEIDTYTSIDKQYLMIQVILKWYDLANVAIRQNKDLRAIEMMKVNERIGRLKYVKEKEAQNEVKNIMLLMESEFQALKEE